VLVRKQRNGNGTDALTEGERVYLNWPEDAALVLDHPQGGIA
jgi:hypothetical protein